MAPYDPDSIPPQDWGFSSSAQFTTTLHNGPSPSTDPSKVRLPSNQTICILGASRGIGAGIALSYAKAGAGTLILASRRVSGLEETRDRCKKVNPDVEVLIVPCDVTSADSVSDLAKKVEEKYGRLDVVVVNSGLVGAAVTDLTTDDPAEISGTMDVNYTGTYYAAKYFTSLLLKSENGAKAFIAINSLAALLIRGPIANSKYAISKLAQVRLMEHLHEQKGGEGLNAFALHPGAVQTEMSQGAPSNFKDFLVDSDDMCGAFCVWLTKDGAEARSWLSGRLLSSNWDVDELEQKKQEVIEKDLLKIKLSL